VQFETKVITDDRIINLLTDNNNDT